MTADQKWKAVSENDEQYDSIFFYGVKSTKIFCRPSCKSKLPLKRNIVYFDSIKQAVKAGHRPCKRCRPDLLEYQPIREIAEKIKLLLNRYFNQENELAKEIGQIGVTGRRMVNIFKEYYGITPKKYYNYLRIEEAKKQLINTNDKIIDIAYGVGFASLSAFYTIFKKNTNLSPAKYRKGNNHGIRSEN
ncbi:MAG: helix-turn-helix domain-containing protein [Treponema sp.]|jgi:AraC family transcriptional regulator of adaptative response / methylphosphotriester-DNA alkyltransferase methyltransferase|nr:helix-turn-helix domain-containing protein [Treponema sp.]